MQLKRLKHALLRIKRSVQLNELVFKLLPGMERDGTGYSLHQSPTLKSRSQSIASNGDHLQPHALGK